ncbi:MAG: endonuclease/exonuclease/phosphatase family protein [Burkholderiales bacterium]|nr:endonuclease/exonuclease/phosphatase family protein [Burkholderiales bacterium]
MVLTSWNVQWCRGADGAVDVARVLRDARAFADFDVLCLQEVAVGFDGLPGSAGEDQFGELAAGLPGFEAHLAIGTDLPRADPHDGRGPRRRFGNALFSRRPVRQVWRHALPWPPDAGTSTMQRVALEAVIDAPDGAPLRVITTHLEYGSRAQRVAQVERLRALHAEACAHAVVPRADGDAGEPFEVTPRPARALLCGDFNFAPDAPERAALLAPFDAAHVPAWCDAWTVVHGPAPHAPTVGLHDRRWPLGTWDFVFVTADLADRVVGIDVDATTTASDHQPLSVRVE